MQEIYDELSEYYTFITQGDSDSMKISSVENGEMSIEYFLPTSHTDESDPIGYQLQLSKEFKADKLSKSTGSGSTGKSKKRSREKSTGGVIEYTLEKSERKKEIEMEEKLGKTKKKMHI